MNDPMLDLSAIERKLQEDGLTTAELRIIAGILLRELRRNGETPLARMRKRSQLSQGRVADALCLSRTAWTMIEIGKSKMQIDYIPILAHLFNTEQPLVLAAALESYAIYHPESLTEG